MPDLVSALLLRIRLISVRNATLFIILLAVYLVISLPFKSLAIIPGFTDVRPVCMLMPVYGIFFGLPGWQMGAMAILSAAAVTILFLHLALRR